MASIPSNLKLRYKAWNTVLFDGVPMFRAQAWALLDARLNGVKFTVNSANRNDATVKRFRGKGLRPGYSSQKELYDGFARGLPGYFPANPPGRSSHEGFSDGLPFYGVPAGHAISKVKYGIDAVDRPGGDAAELVRWLNAHGYSATRPYNTTSERHHFAFAKSPAANARKRLTAHTLRHAKKHDSRQMKVSVAGTAAIAGFEGFRSAPYRDAVGVWTIGFGHTAGVSSRSKPLSRTEALRLLRNDLNNIYAPHVQRLNLHLTQNQFDALVSFVYNLGPGAIDSSTGIGRELRSNKPGHWKRAADEMLKWDKAGGRTQLGLTRRRQAERKRFLRRL